MELAEYITIKMGIPFREAHHIVGSYVRQCLGKKLEPLSDDAYSIFQKNLPSTRKTKLALRSTNYF